MFTKKDMIDALIIVVWFVVVVGGVAGVFVGTRRAMPIILRPFARLPPAMLVLLPILVPFVAAVLSQVLFGRIMSMIVTAGGGMTTPWGRLVINIWSTDVVGSYGRRKPGRD